MLLAAIRKCAPAVLAALWAASFIHYGSTKRAVPDRTDAVCIAGGGIDGGAGRPALPNGRTNGILVGRDVPVAPAAAASCGCASGEGRMLVFNCTAECPCGGCCSAAGAYALEGASFAVTGGVCRCGFDDPAPWRGDSCSCVGVGGSGCPCVVCTCHGADAGPGLSVSFGRAAVVFEEAYVDAPGVWRPRVTSRTPTSAGCSGTRRSRARGNGCPSKRTIFSGWTRRRTTRRSRGWRRTGGRRTTLDGLTTTAMVSGPAPMKDDVLVPFENVYLTPDAYLPSSVVVADGVRNLVGGGIYRDSTERGSLTFRKLVPGRRYLIQLWSCDMRSAERDYKMQYDHAVRVGYFTGTAGGWATYVFTATDETETIPAQGNHAWFSWQLNAVQVRQLDDADGTVVWSGGENVTAAWTRSYLVKTTVGRTTCAEALPNLRRVVVSAGTFAFTEGQPSALALEAWDTGRIEVGEGVVLSGVSVRGTGTIAGAGRVAFTAGGMIDMPSALTVDGVVWELAHGTTLAYADGANLGATRILIADPAARLTERDTAAVVTVAGTLVGEPTFLFPVGESGKWTVRWDASASAFVLKKRIGLAIVLR